MSIDSSAHPITARFSLTKKQFNLNIDLQLPGKGITGIFGPSGCGKSTLLRAMAGLETESKGRLSIGHEVWQDSHQKIFIPTYQRALAYVFQEANLFNHLTVSENLLFGFRRIPISERRIPLEHAVTLLNLQSLMTRYPSKLSGGEKQRVSIGRALLTSPRLFLMDEPLSALDSSRKEEILPYLVTLSTELEIPVIYVTHSAEEIVRLCDYLAVMDQGMSLIHGPINDLLTNPERSVLGRDDQCSIIEAKVTRHSDSDALTYLTFSDQSLKISRCDEPVGAVFRCRILARDVSVCRLFPEATSILNILPATIIGLQTSSTFGEVIVQLELGGCPLLARITYKSASDLALKIGESIWAQIKAVSLLK